MALALWAAVVADASLEGVFARLEPEAYGALAVFVTIFAVVAACCDAEARQALDALPHKLASALMLDASILAAIALASDATNAWTGLLPAMALLVVLPVAVVLHATLLRAPRLRRAPGASPGAKRAAT